MAEATKEPKAAKPVVQKTFDDKEQAEKTCIDLNGKRKNSKKTGKPEGKFKVYTATNGTVKKFVVGKSPASVAPEIMLSFGVKIEAVDGAVTELVKPKEYLKYLSEDAFAELEKEIETVKTAK